MPSIPKEHFDLGVEIQGQRFRSGCDDKQFAVSKKRLDCPNFNGALISGEDASR
jgi:hypothetical protein